MLVTLQMKIIFEDFQIVFFPNFLPFHYLFKFIKDRIWEKSGWGLQFHLTSWFLSISANIRKFNAVYICNLYLKNIENEINESITINNNIKVANFL